MPLVICWLLSLRGFNGHNPDTKFKIRITSHEPLLMKVLFNDLSLGFQLMDKTTCKSPQSKVTIRSCPTATLPLVPHLLWIDVASSSTGDLLQLAVPFPKLLQLHVFLSYVLIPQLFTHGNLVFICLSHSFTTSLKSIWFLLVET